MCVCVCRVCVVCVCVRICLDDVGGARGMQGLHWRARGEQQQQQQQYCSSTAAAALWRECDVRVLALGSAALTARCQAKYSVVLG